MSEFPQPKKYTARVSNKTYLNDKTIKMNFELDPAQNFSFIPGQFINIQVSPFAFRSYSLCSDYQNKEQISIIFTVDHEGVGVNYLKELKQDDEITFIGPSGRFVLPDKFEKEILFLVTSTGIAPVFSMLYQLIHLNPEAQIRLYFGIRNENDAFMLDELENFKDQLRDFDYFVCVSNPSESFRGLNGRITQYYNFDNAKDVQAFLCGNPNMIEEVNALLVAQGVSPERIYQEKFTVGSVNAAFVDENI